MDEDLVEALEIWLQSRFEQVHTQFPGRVEVFDAKTRLARIKPLVRPRSLHADVFNIPPIDDVPVIFPGGSKGSHVYRLLPGDFVLVLVSEVSLGNWLNGSGEVDAEDESRFTLNDAIAIGGLWTKSTVPSQGTPDLDVGMIDSTRGILGLIKGKIAAENAATSLRAEINKIWDAMRTTRTDVAMALSALSPAATAPAVASGALAAAFTTQALLFGPGTPADLQITAGKNSLGSLLK